MPGNEGWHSPRGDASASSSADDGVAPAASLNSQLTKAAEAINRQPGSDCTIGGVHVDAEAGAVRIEIDLRLGCTPADGHRGAIEEEVARQLTDLGRQLALLAQSEEPGQIAWHLKMAPGARTRGGAQRAADSS